MARSVSHFTREEEADRCLNGTEFTRGSAIACVGIFVAFCLGAPIVQNGIEIRDNLKKRDRWDPASGEPRPGLAPKITHVVDLAPSRDQIGKAKGFWGYWELIPSVEAIEKFEGELKEDSIFTQALLSPAQAFISGWLGGGNEKAYLGAPGWIFYRPDVDVLTDGPFLDPDRLRRRSRGKVAVQPDPIRAIVDFGKQLERRGCRLIVVPAPAKPVIEPDRLNPTLSPTSKPTNSSMEPFVAGLEREGVEVYDPTDDLVALRAKGVDAYLESDTHWTPDAMEIVARELARRVGGGRSPIDREVTVSNVGDLADMLKLPKGQRLYQPQTVRIRPVEGGVGPSGETLLLGDSFSNIYSLEAMGWGANAGLAERLSAYIGKVDKIAINAGGASASRLALARQLAGGSDRLANKRVVIYEFAMRDLGQGDWKMIDLPKTDSEPVEPRLSISPRLNVVRFTQEGVVEVSGVARARIEVVDAVGRRVAEGPADRPLDLRSTTPGSYRVIVRARSERGWLIRPWSTEVRREPKGEIKLTPVGGEWVVAAPKDWPLEFGVLDARGRTVRRRLTPMSGRLKWDGLDDAKRPVPTGDYRIVAQRVGGAEKATALFKWTATTTPSPAVATNELIVEGVIAARSNPPKPGSVPYKDCLIALHLKGLAPAGGPVRGPNIVVYVWGMRDNRLVDGSYLVGRHVRFKLEKWSSAEGRVGGVNRIELESDESLAWPAYYGEIKK